MEEKVICRRRWTGSVNTGENTVSGIEASNPLELLAVFLSRPRTASNLNMYPRLLQVEGCDQREHSEDERIHVSQTFASRRVRSKRAFRGRANKYGIILRRMNGLKNNYK